MGSAVTRSPRALLQAHAGCGLRTLFSGKEFCVFQPMSVYSWKSLGDLDPEGSLGATAGPQLDFMSLM